MLLGHRFMWTCH